MAGESTGSVEVGISRESGVGTAVPLAPEGLRSRYGEGWRRNIILIV